MGSAFLKPEVLLRMLWMVAKVRIDGVRAKNAREVKLGMMISIKNKDMDIEVAVTGLSNIRRGAQEAAQLYAETEESKQKNVARKASFEQDFAARERGAGRPTKRQLRDIKNLLE